MPSNRDAASAACARLAAARDEALAGNFVAFGRALADASECDAAAWRPIARTLRWMAGFEGPEDPTAPLPADDPDAPQLRACAVEAAARRVVASFLRFDAARLEEHAQRAIALGREVEDPTTTVRAAVASSWRAVVSGRPEDDDEMAAIERDARGIGCAELVVDIASLRGLALASAGAFDDALACARRASRMGRTERLPQSEYLAGLVLARLRRLTGRPFLATRIASSLRRFAPAPWHGWIDWEIAQASGATPTDAGAPASDLRELLQAASDGDRAAFGRAGEHLRERYGGLDPFAADLDRADAVLDPLRPLHDMDPDIAAWCRGEDPFAPIPYGLAGLNGPLLDDEVLVGVGVVVVQPGRAGRRVLRAARGLASALGGKRWLADRKIGRTEGLVAALALAGPQGIDDETLFQSVYGFAYSPELHRGTFDVALHRARGRIEPFGRITRQEGRLVLEVDRSFVVPDPRSTPGSDNRVLGRLARAEELSARDLAGALGIPLRTVQDALRGLVEAGACRQHRSGRNVLYAIEDTTFQEPTLG